MSSEETKQLGEAGWLTEVLSGALGQSLEAMTTERPAIESSVVAANELDPDASESWYWWEQPLSIPSSVLWIGTAEQSWMEIGKFALAAAGIDDATADDSRGTWCEICSQALSATATALGRKIRQEVNCQGGSAISSRPKSACCISLRIGIGGEFHHVRFAWNETIQAILQPRETASPNEGNASAAAAGAGSAPTKNSSLAIGGSRTLDLLLEVELPVSVSFGRAHLPLKDVM